MEKLIEQTIVGVTSRNGTTRGPIGPNLVEFGLAVRPQQRFESVYRQTDRQTDGQTETGIA